MNIVYSGKKMLERCCKGAHCSVKNYFKGFSNVKIYSDQKVVATEKDQLITDKVSYKFLLLGRNRVLTFARHIHRVNG